MTTVDKELLARAMKRLDGMYRDEMEYADIDIKAAITQEYEVIRNALRTVIVGVETSQ